MRFSSDLIRVARVLSEDADFVTLGVSKWDGVPGDDNPQPPQFLTLIWIHNVDGQAQVWDPFAAEGGG